MQNRDRRFHQLAGRLPHLRDITAAQADGQLAHFRSRKEQGQYVFRHLDRVAFMERFRQLSRHSIKIGTLTLDVMHLACACEIQADSFISFDERQCALAQLAGLKVLEPIAD